MYAPVFFVMLHLLCQKRVMLKGTLRRAMLGMTKIFLLEVKHGKWKLMFLNLICVNGLLLEQLLSLTEYKSKYEMLVKDIVIQISH